MKEIYHEDDEVSLSFECHQSKTTVFSFTGVGLKLGGINDQSIQQEEFKETLNAVPCNRVFVIDKKRTWYSNKHLHSVVHNFFTQIHTSWPVKKTIGLGNSMGATGAIIFGNIFNFDIVLAFAPQILNPLFIHDDKRWNKKYVNHILKDHAIYKKCCNFCDIRSKSMLKNTLIFYGNKDKNDMLLQAKQLTLIGYDPFIIDDCGHNVAKKLKKAGMLSKIIALSLHKNYDSVLEYANKNFRRCSHEMEAQRKIHLI